MYDIINAIVVERKNSDTKSFFIKNYAYEHVLRTKLF